MVYTVTFSQNNQVLDNYKFEVTDPQEYMLRVDVAHEIFRREHPSISLFDGVTVVFNRELI